MHERHQLYPTRDQAWRIAAQEVRFFRSCVDRYTRLGPGHELELMFAHSALAWSVVHLLFAWGGNDD